MHLVDLEIYVSECNQLTSCSITSIDRVGFRQMDLLLSLNISTLGP